MGELCIRRVTIAEIEAAPNLVEFLAEYAAESSQPELGESVPQFPTYRALEAAGALHPIAAFEGKRIAGFILPIVGVLPHYASPSAMIESFFVPKADRKKGIGLRLKAEAEALAIERGAKGFMISAPVGSALSKVLAKSPAYRRSHDVFVKAL